MPLTIGLTGGIAAGKSEALAAFGRLGAATLSSDAVVHELLESEPLRGRLVERWGPEVVPDGSVDRGRIGEIVFADPEQLTWLESQIHPLVGAADRRLARRAAGRDRDRRDRGAAALRGGREEVFDTTVAIVTADEVRRERAAARGHALVDEREARQLTQDEKAEPGRPRGRQRRLGRGPRAGAVRADREAAAMRRGAAVDGAGWSSARSRSWSASLLGVLVASGTFDKAIKELTLPLRHEDIIRQQAAEKGVDAALIAAVIYSESKFSDADLAAPAPAG